MTSKNMEDLIRELRLAVATTTFILPIEACEPNLIVEGRQKTHDRLTHNEWDGPSKEHPIHWRWE